VHPQSGKMEFFPVFLRTFLSKKSGKKRSAKINKADGEQREPVGGL
jgi:hypothetical protein